MGPLFCSYFSFHLPKPLLLLLLLLNRISLVVSLLLVFLRLQRPQPRRREISPDPFSFHVYSDHPREISSSASPPSPASAAISTIKSRLPVVQFARFAGEEDHPATCIFCFGGFVASDEVRELGNCRHAFHRECIDRWIDVDGLTCPLCRSALLPSLPPAAEKKGIVEFLARVWRRG